MARLPESKETLDAIREKALRYTIQRGTFKKPSVFNVGRNVVSFSELCAMANQLKYLS
ncbi:MAG: hypothetical protein ACJAS1_000477 [Oleiphilaceae bacterium]|jgi:hypothetical protein